MAQNYDASESPARPLRIAINAHLLGEGDGYRRAGVSAYVRQMLRCMPEIGAQHTYDVFLPPGAVFPGEPPAHVRLARSRMNTTGPIQRIVWEQGIAPWRITRRKYDVLLCPVNVMPLMTRCPTVVTIHDLAFMRFRLHRRLRRFYLDQMTRRSAHRAAHVITVSEFTRQEVLELLKLPEASVTAVHNGIDAMLKPQPAEALAAFRKSQKLPERFVLFVGTLEPRKNIETLLRAYALAGEKIGMPLIVGGGKGWHFDGIFQLVKELKLESRVEFRGFLPDEQLPLYYSAATVLVYPSLYEGFGLPPLEAMAAGTPVIVSDAGGIGEVVADAGMVVRAQDATAWAEAMVRMTGDEALRADYRARGLRRAAEFSWMKAARETLAILERVAVDAR
jgi:glycosyltransferase involved in cell wall biosynthesis